MHSSKWQGSVEIPVAASVEHLWEIASDFCGLRRWYPALQVCERVEGTPLHGPGCMRFCSIASSSAPSPDEILRAKEKLISFDSTNHSYTYVIIETNMEGFLGYQATFQVLPGEEAGKCVVKWRFEVEPVSGRSEKEFVGNWTSVLAGAVKKLEDFAAFSSSYSSSS